MYRTPWAVTPEFEFRDTPDHYHRTYPGPGKLPDRIRVWRVQDSPRGSMVSPPFGFLDSPDAEIIAVGFSLAKAYGAIGIGRQANFLQWGYGDPPSQMTEAGRRLFLNCIHYIHRFDGQTPLVHRCAEARDSAIYVASMLAGIEATLRQGTLIVPKAYGSPPEPREGSTRLSLPVPGTAFRRGTEATSVPMFGPDPWLSFETTLRAIPVPPETPSSVSAEPKEFFLKTFAPDLYDRYHADSNGLATYYKTNLELVYWDGVFRVDDDLRLLGLKSNREVETLECLFELRKDPAHRQVAQRLLNRYTDGHTTFDFQNGRDRIYFSDVGGYKFFVVPQGYLVARNSGTGISESASR